jgi:hypothetical protein
MLRKIIRRELHPKGEYCFQNDGKKLLLIMLMFMQTAAYAGWEKLLAIDNTTVYVDMSRGQSTQEIVTVFELRDCSEQREFMGSMYGFSFRSSQFLTEYKCSTREKRHLESLWFADQMGNGKISFRKMNPQDWAVVDDDPVSKALFEHFCIKN